MIGIKKDHRRHTDILDLLSDKTGEQMPMSWALKKGDYLLTYFHVPIDLYSGNPTCRI